MRKSTAEDIAAAMDEITRTLLATNSNSFHFDVIEKDGDYGVAVYDKFSGPEETPFFEVSEMILFFLGVGI